MPSPAAAITLLRLFQDRLGDNVTAFELIRDTGMSFVAPIMPGLVDPLDGNPAWRVLTEITGAAGSDLDIRAEAALGVAFERGLAEDGVLASSEAQRINMWNIREHLPEGNRHVGSISSHDISLPIGRVAAFLDEADRRVHAVDAALRINCFGHMGDGNLHYNLFPPEGRAHRDYDNRRKALKRLVHDLVHEMGGSVSAEHGIGRLKTEDLVRYGDPAKLAAMRAIKTALDPSGIMNPGAVLTDRP